MATLSYSSFPGPRVADELVSSSSPSSSPSSATSSRSSSLAIALPRTEQLSIMDAAAPIALKVTDVPPENAVDDDEDSDSDDADGLSLLHITPATPTKGRTRRATMPDSMKPVSPPPSFLLPHFQIATFEANGYVCSSRVFILLPKHLGPRLIAQLLPAP